ncbi:CotO family spore coat protein [Virgibacillus kimchii]
MANRKYARDPMLYIQQPGSKNPRASMQYSYRTKKVPSSQSLEGGSIRSRNFINEERELHEREEKLKGEQEESEGEDFSPAEENKRISFNERTLEEKISYFTDAPTYAPKKRCEIKTDNKTYRGIITDRDEEHVFVRVGNRSKAMKIMINEITSIRLLGFS